MSDVEESTKLSSIVRMLARARSGAKRPTPTQSTCLYYCHGNEASKCVCVQIRFLEMIWVVFYLLGALA